MERPTRTHPDFSVNDLRPAELATPSASSLTEKSGWVALPPCHPRLSPRFPRRAPCAASSSAQRGRGTAAGGGGGGHRSDPRHFWVRAPHLQAGRRRQPPPPCSAWSPSPAPLRCAGEDQPERRAGTRVPFEVFLPEDELPAIEPPWSPRGSRRPCGPPHNEGGARRRVVPPQHVGAKKRSNDAS